MYLNFIEPYLFIVSREAKSVDVRDNFDMFYILVFLARRTLASVITRGYLIP